MTNIKNSNIENSDFSDCDVRGCNIKNGIFQKGCVVHGNLIYGCDNEASNKDAEIVDWVLEQLDHGVILSNNVQRFEFACKIKLERLKEGEK